MPHSDFDHHMMGIALTMARRGLGRTAPNPSVGAVVADPATGVVFARATTAIGGRPHAEPIAIATAGAHIRGATLYVTLEPCSHFGATAPCCDAIIAAGIGRVVCGIEDPDPRVAGRGLARLRAVGVIVERGVRAAECHEVTAGHIDRVTQRRPFVQLKLAVQADGMVPQAENGAPLFVTSLEARAMGHLMRARADAILVGRGTVEADNPELTCRLPGMIDRSPERIVLASGGLDLVGTRLQATGDGAGITVFAAVDAHRPAIAAHRIQAMEAAGARVYLVASVGGALWLPAVLERLAECGITRLLVEGGPTVWRAFARAGLVDEIVLFHAQAAAVDRTTAKTQMALAIARHLDIGSVVVHDERRLGADRVWWLRPVGGRVTPAHNH